MSPLPTGTLVTTRCSFNPKRPSASVEGKLLNRSHLLFKLDLFRSALWPSIRLSNGLSPEYTKRRSLCSSPSRIVAMSPIHHIRHELLAEFLVLLVGLYECFSPRTYEISLLVEDTVLLKIHFLIEISLIFQFGVDFVVARLCL